MSNDGNIDVEAPSHAAQSQQSRMELGLRVSVGLQRANNLDYRRTSRREALRCSSRRKANYVYALEIGDSLYPDAVGERQLYEQKPSKTAK